MTDCSAPSWGRMAPPDNTLLGSRPYLIISAAQQQQAPPGETESWGRSEEVRFPVGCAKWQLFKLKVTAGWIGLIYCQCQSSLTPFCVRACQRAGSDLFTSLHWLKGNQETVRGGTEPKSRPKGSHGFLGWLDLTGIQLWEPQRPARPILGEWKEARVSFREMDRNCDQLPCNFQSLIFFFLR